MVNTSGIACCHGHMFTPGSSLLLHLLTRLLNYQGYAQLAYCITANCCISVEYSCVGRSIAQVGLGAYRIGCVTHYDLCRALRTVSNSAQALGVH